MPDSELKHLLDIGLRAVTEAADMALHPQEKLHIETKSSRNDVVTQIDKSIEELLAHVLYEATGYPLHGEEKHSTQSFQGRVWVLDPIDGTMNYVATHRDYAVSLALCEDGIPVVGIVADVTAGKYYTAIKGEGAWCNGKALPKVEPLLSYTESVIITDLKEIVALSRLVDVIRDSRGHRRYGAAALECVEVAAGRAGAFVHLMVSPWDIAAAVLICEECGVKVTRLDGTPMDICSPGSILAAWPQAHRDLVNKLICEPL
ncbi:MAG: inositol monophosphatase family protein [Actinomycetaceae bacterium]|nr:inositol monophosphatase family protein [Actinomycetaceae bacterium]